MSVRPLAFLALAGLAAQGCGRCAGVLGCTGDPRLSLDGQFIVHATGATVPGVTVDFIRTGGAPLASDSVRAVTDAGGNFQLAVGALQSGAVTGDVSVHPPAPWRPYRITGQTFETSGVRGMGTVLGRWVVDPFVQYVVGVYRRYDQSPLAGAQVTFVGTGGAQLTPDSFVTAADTTGRIFFPAAASSPGTALARVTVASPLLPHTYTLTDVPISAYYIDSLPPVAAVWTLGWSLHYAALVVSYNNGAGIRGAMVHFQRTGGVPATPDTLTSPTSVWGFADLPLHTLDSGTVVGDLTIHPPAPYRDTTITGLRLQTFDNDSTRVAGVFPVTSPP